jgi:hypothetical protein
MAFKLALKPTFKARVEVYTANQKGGHDKSTFMAEFLRTDMDELEELQNMPQPEVMRKKLAGWSELTDDEDNPVDYNQETLNALLKIPEALMGLRIAFWSSIHKSREKN